MKKIKNRKLEITLALIVEFIEFTIIVMVGNKVLNVDFEGILAVLITFFISRLLLKIFGFKNGHYKIKSYFDGGWVRCFGYTMLLLLSLFLTSKISLLIGVLLSILSPIIISNFANIDELIQGKKSEYNSIYCWCRKNQSHPKLIEFKKKLEDNYILNRIYEDIIIGGLGLEEVAFELGYSYPSYLEKPINRLIGRLEADIFEIYELLN